MALAADLAKTFPRRFVPADANMGDPAQVETLFHRVLGAVPDSPAALERWLEDASEVLAAIEEERALRYIAMTCQTDDPVREQAHLFFVEHVMPKVKPLLFQVQQAYLQSPHRRQLPSRYAVFDRLIENRVSLFRRENVPLETEEATLKQQYQKIVGAMTVTFRGTEHTLQQMLRYLEEPNRALRQEAWELVTRRRLQDREAMEDLFDRLLALRDHLARNAGFSDYRAYAFRLLERFDYGPEDCLRFHQAIEQTVLPLLHRLQAARKQSLGVDTLRPWDLEVDPLGRAPLRPFQTVDRLAEGVEEIFRRVDPDLGEQFRFMRDRALLDLESRKGKAPGGYQRSLDEQRVPFIFMNAVGVDGDLRTLLHEGGHAFHLLAARHQPLVDYREAPIEFSEVASMGMELLAIPYLSQFYPDPEQTRRSVHEMLERTVSLFPWIATIDAFQHWMYTHSGHTREDRRAAWVRTFRRFAPDVDFSGYEDALDWAWHRQLHVFLYPFYYVEYGIAEVGALQIWRRSLDDHADAVRQYRAALALGGSRPLPELFAAAGIQFDFSAQTLGPLIDAVAAALGRTRPQA